MAIMQVVDKINDAVEKKNETTIGDYLYVSKAFDTIDHFRITAIWPGDRIRRPEHPTENEVRRYSCDESL